MLNPPFTIETCASCKTMQGGYDVGEFSVDRSRFKDALAVKISDCLGPDLTAGASQSL